MNVDFSTMQKMSDSVCDIVMKKKEELDKAVFAYECMKQKLEKIERVLLNLEKNNHQGTDTYKQFEEARKAATSEYLILDKARWAAEAEHEAAAMALCDVKI